MTIFRNEDFGLIPDQQIIPHTERAADSYGEQMEPGKFKVHQYDAYDCLGVDLAINVDTEVDARLLAAARIFEISCRPGYSPAYDTVKLDLQV